jgi:hypothetical protein
MLCGVRCIFVTTFYTTPVKIQFFFFKEFVVEWGVCLFENVFQFLSFIVLIIRLGNDT